MECRQCLPLSVVQLKGKHCRKPHCRNGALSFYMQLRFWFFQEFLFLQDQISLPL